MKQTINQLSLRAKFKDPRTVEITVVNHREGITYQIHWYFISDKVTSETHVDARHPTPIKEEYN